MVDESTQGGVDSACHPYDVGEMSTSVLVEGHSISDTVVLPRNDSYVAAKRPYAKTEQNILVNNNLKPILSFSSRPLNKLEYSVEYGDETK